jgi:Ca2+/Na+ antiporter
MATGRRPSHVYRGPARRPPAPAGVNTMKVAGTLFCVSAVISIVVQAASRATGEPATGQTAAFGGAFFILLLGLGLYQGVGGIRIFILVCAGLASLAAIGLAAVFHSMRELQVLALALLVTAVGYFALLLKKEASKARVGVSVGLIILGVAGTLAAEFWLAGYGVRAFGAELQKVASDQREYADPEAGLTIVVPEGWVILREDAELYQGVPSRVTLADPAAGAVAFVNYERKAPGLLTLDHYLDAVLERLNAAGLDARQSERADVTVGRAPARRMALTWQEDGQRVSGFLSTWLDGDIIYTFIGASPGGWTSSTEQRFAVLEGALSFTAPVETALSEAQARLTAECPIFTPAAVRTIGGKIPPDSAAEVYFRTAWSWAVKGQGQLDAAAVAELGQLMGEVFSAMPEGERRRFGAYTEKVRGGRRTSRAEDAAAMRALGRAAGKLSPGSLGRLQILTETALSVGALL